MTTLAPAPLSAHAFAPFGEVIEIDKARRIQINDGLTTRFHDLLSIDIAGPDGRPVVSVFRSKPLPLPHRIQKLERHPLGSQAFLPMDDNPFLVLVAAVGNTGAIPVAALRLFITNGRQGLNLHRNTWHHFQIVLHRQSDFVVIDRDGAGHNLEEAALDGEAWIGEV